MKKPITRTMHGITDYSYAALLTAAPKLFGFEKEKSASLLCYGLGGGALLYSLFTRYELGMFKLMPFKTHLAIDLASNIAALAAPWVLGFSQNKRACNTCLVAATTGLVVSAFTQTDEMPATADL
ncbi:MAG: hypothetical protein COW65_13610 [Cytophagales bacterium CG18_big_fil_WC_8_21_14_2_50_42_9]|nr:MAG: hypothetical protein COW65_13610 [Cytophagales bacterium CG18_big_fil_WC_8_21_14_2_50_42_9]